MKIHYISLTLIALLSIAKSAIAQNPYSARIEQPDPLPLPSICMVMVDPETEKNMIIWEKEPGLLINSYQVLKTAGAGYTLVAERSGTDSSFVIDWNSKPGTKTDAYVLVSFDTCGNATEKSLWHKPFLLQSSIGLKGVVNLSWQPYLVDGSEYNFKSIVIYRGTDSTQLEPIETITAGIGSYTYTDENPPLDVNVYYRIGGEKEIACNPNNIPLKKTSSGPFVHSLSNLEDNRLQSTGINPKSSAETLKIFPNPMTNVAKLRWDNSESPAYRLSIYDLSGSLIRTTKGIADSGQISIERGDLESGCYIIALSGSKTVYGKLMVK